LGRLTWTLGEVVETVMETTTVKTIALEIPDWTPHRAGQHVDVRLTAEDGYQAQRSYSIASAPEQEHVLLTVERLEDGEVSTYLVDELRVGDLLELRGPIGGYFVWESTTGGPLLLVAGGSGIVPLMAMVRHRVATGSDTAVRLLYSCRSYRDIIYRQELDLLQRTDPRLAFSYTLTRSSPADWSGYRGRIDRDMLEHVSRDDGIKHSFVCGPTGFVEAAAGYLVDLGFDPSAIKTERFGPTGDR
jgi:ferredoxin-NADP reductase